MEMELVEATGVTVRRVGPNRFVVDVSDLLNRDAEHIHVTLTQTESGVPIRRETTIVPLSNRRVPSQRETSSRRIPVQRESRSRRSEQTRRAEQVLQRVITESIETHIRQSRPASPTHVAELLRKVEVANIPQGQCPICLDDFQAEKMEVCSITSCSHCFHRACIIKWLEHSNVCPLCRFVFPTKELLHV